LVTPTGAAILVTLAQSYGPVPLTRIDRIGHGLGSREIAGRANLLRLLAQDDLEEGPLLRDTVTMLTTHIDDMNPEWYGGLSEQLWQAGVLDVALTAITMKQGRPGVCLEVMVAEEKAEGVAALLLQHSTALGVRMQSVPRVLLPRRIREVESPWGRVRVKEAAGVGKVEYADVWAMAQREGCSLPQMQQRLWSWLVEQR
jgi:uncharacterized protein (DUF111 family)